MWFKTLNPISQNWHVKRNRQDQGIHNLLCSIAKASYLVNLTIQSINLNMNEINIFEVSSYFINVQYMTFMLDVCVREWHLPWTFSTVICSKTSFKITCSYLIYTIFVTRNLSGDNIHVQHYINPHLESTGHHVPTTLWPSEIAIRNKKPKYFYQLWYNVIYCVIILCY